MCARLDAHVAEPVGGFTDVSIDGLLAAATESPAGFRLLFQHALREPEFSERIEKFRADITSAAFLQISALVRDQALARRAAQLAPAVARLLRPGRWPATSRLQAAKARSPPLSRQ